MKLQSLAIIFIIIIIPITIVLSEYVNNRIKTETTELEYNTRILNATYDSIKAYQLNTVNNEFGDITNSKISDIEAAVTTFYNSLVNNFNFTGYNSSTMSEYVPAVAFTLYDGYYIYSPFINELTGVDITTDDGDPVDYDKDYSEPGIITNGLKPYIYYSASYVDESKGWDFIITYTLDNYITIMGQIGFNGTEPNYVYDYGYLYPIASNKDASNDGHGIFYDSPNDSYYFDGIEFKKDDTEELKEYVGDTEYSYVKINGKKYYLEENPSNISMDDDGKTNKNARFFFISDKGEKDYSQVKLWDKCSDSEKDVFRKYYSAVKHNKSAYMYYKKAYEFSKAVLGGAVIDYKDKAGTPQSGYNLLDSELKPMQCKFYVTGDKADELKQSGITLLSEYGGDFNIFEGDIHLANSNFNKHRKAIIRYVIETNLAPAISGFSNRAHDEFIMPKISEEDWESIQNDVCEISFLQGINIGSKKYNGYSVVANMLTKEYIDEDDIYILTTDNTYCKANDRTFNDSGKIKPKTNYYSGIWKINFERKRYLKDGQDYYYYPISYYDGGQAKGYLGSYTSIMGSTQINEIGSDMYTYMHSKNDALKKAYYIALGRERWCAYNVNNVNYELYGSNANDQFFKDY